jgi:hypothetical protein
MLAIGRTKFIASRQYTVTGQICVHPLTLSWPFSPSLIPPTEMPSPSPPAISIAVGVTAVTNPPCFRTAPETVPIIPLEPPPYTSERPSITRARPRAKGADRSQSASEKVTLRKEKRISDKLLHAGRRDRFRDTPRSRRQPGGSIV